MIALQEQIDRTSRLLLQPDFRYRRNTGQQTKPGLTTHLASSRHEIESALHLVHQAYVETDLIASNPFELRVTKYHLLPTTNVFLACEEDELIGTLTLVRDGAHGLPMEEVYGDVIAQRRARGLRVAEVSCLADAGCGKSSMLAIVIQLMSHMAQFAHRHDVDELVIAVHPHHVGFYERFVGFEVIAGQRPYGSVGDNPAVALAGDLKNIHIKNPRVHQRFFGKPFAEQDLSARPLSPAAFDYFRNVLRQIEASEHHDGQSAAA